MKIVNVVSRSFGSDDSSQVMAVFENQYDAKLYVEGKAYMDTENVWKITLAPLNPDWD